MKLCLILAGAEDGGLENHVLTLCNRFAGQHQVTLLAHKKYARRLDAGVRFIPMPMSLGRRNPWLLLRLLVSLKRVAPDLIHAHGNKATSLLAVLKPLLTTPCIGTVHSQKRNLSMFEKMDGVIGVSNGVLEPVQHSLKKVIYNGVDKFSGTPLDRNQLLGEWQLPADKPLCLAVGRLVPVKAYDVLIRAWKNKDASLVIVGDGPEQLRLEKIITTLGLQQQVKLVGYRSDVQAILPAAQVLAISSQREGFSLVLVEALLAGVGVVSTCVAGSREILPRDCLCPVGDVAALSAALDRALANPEWLAVEYFDVFSFARECLTTDAMLHHTAGYYDQVLRICAVTRK
jgi:glycosyltransferase involved in cell wall biosynthesis